MRARIDITEVETRTKIRAKYLRAIENEDWERLPGPVYVRSFLRTYGDFLGLDSRLLVDEYKRRYQPPADNEHHRTMPPPPRERERRQRGPLLPSWAVIGMVLVAVVVVLYVVGNLSSNKSSSGGNRHARTHTTRRHRAGSPVGARTQPVTAPAKPAKVVLQLVPTSQVYVCLVDGAGKPLIPGVIYSPGQTIPTKRSGKLLLTLGNNSVQMKVNGSPVSVPASATSIGYLLQPSGVSSLPVPRQPRCT